MVLDVLATAHVGARSMLECQTGFGATAAKQLGDASCGVLMALVSADLQSDGTY
jgi:hypothetical protein